MSPDAEAPREPVVMARDASYIRRSYRSFEFATFSVAPGEVAVVLARDAATVRDVLLAVAGFVHPTRGSLTVAGVELAEPVHRRLVAPGATLPRGTAGVGVVSGFADVDQGLTVTEAVAHEFSLVGRSAGAADEAVLDHLARFSIATQADRMVEQLDALARARLSAALALAGAPQVGVVDLTDAFTQGLTAEDAVHVVRMLLDVARTDGVAVVVGTMQPAAARVAGVVPVGLDIASVEAIVPDAERSAGSAAGATGRLAGKEDGR